MGENQLFSFSNATLHYLGEPLQPEIIQEARETLQRHVVPVRTPRAYLEALLFCIASQRTNYERPLRFLELLHKEPTEALLDVGFLEKKAREGTLLHANRFGPAINFVKTYGRGIEAVVDDYLSKPIEMRRKLASEARYLAFKTASFWYLCLGGKSLMTLDVHNYRQIAGLGIDVKPSHYDGRLRHDGRNIVTDPSKAEYERIEKQTLELLQSQEELRDGDGKTDGGLLTSLFWITGAKIARGQQLRQMRLFGESPQLKFRMPYSGR